MSNSGKSKRRKILLLNAFDNCDVRLDNAVDLLHNRLENVHDAEMKKSKSEFILITKILQSIQCCHFKTRKSNCEM